MENLQAGMSKKVIFLSSQMGSIDDNYSGGYYFYRSSKAALNASAMSLSIDWKDQNIAVLMMHPGWVRTDMGTSKAKLSIEESVTGMLNVIENFTIEQTGAFLNYAGQKLEW
jgi:NAD(P)-dependent dehydrogenase (short-subunit alcohol dehydrogenase family)